jgi:hypothetical protein
MDDNNTTKTPVLYCMLIDAPKVMLFMLRVSVRKTCES